MIGQCKRCDQGFTVRPLHEPTEYCDNCAQVLAALRAFVARGGDRYFKEAWLAAKDAIAKAEGKQDACAACKGTGKTQWSEETRRRYQRDKLQLLQRHWKI